MKAVYFLCRWIGLISGIVPGLLYFRPRYYYEDPSFRPRMLKGGALIVSNHFAVFDYMVSVLLFLPRFLRVVSAEFPYHNRFLTFGMNCFRAIKADRSVRSMRFIDESVKALRAGDNVQIFPEGHNSDDGNVQPFRTPYLMVIARSRKPVIPVVFDGNYVFPKRCHALVGKPILPEEIRITDHPDEEELERANAFIRDRIIYLKSLLDEKIQEEKDGKGRS